MLAKTRLFFRKHFIPHTDNDHRPHALRHGPLFAYGVGLITIKAIAISLAIIIPSASVFSGALSIANVISLTNQARQDSGLEILVQNSTLDSAAQAKADDMLLKGYFSHNSPGGLTPWYWIRDAGYTYKIAGENLAIHFSTVESVHESWLASALHRENILNEDFEEIGIGISRGMFENYNTTFVVQMFGTPAENKTIAAVEETNVREIKDLDPIGEDVFPDTFTPESIIKNNLLAKNIQDSDLVINSSTVRVTPQNGKYHVVAEVHNAENVKAILGAKTADLTLVFEDDDIWQGWIPFGAAEFNAAGAHLFIVAANQNKRVVKNVALAAPSTNPEAIFSLRQRSEYKLLGFIPLQSLDNAVNRFFIIAMFVLGGLLLLNTLIKVHHQKYSTLAHMLILIILAGVLAIL